VAYFEDLSLFTYGHFRQKEGGDPVVSVGWLDDGLPFTQDEVPAELVAKLGVLCAKPVRLMRGYHWCWWCRSVFGEPGSYISASSVPRGNGEVWVQGLGKIYASPVLIHHYIAQHRYLPPREFLDALARISGNDAAR